MPYKGLHRGRDRDLTTKRRDEMTFRTKIIIGIVCWFILMLGSCSYLFKTIGDAGGVKGLLIEAGKEIKEISAEIDKHEVD